MVSFWGFLGGFGGSVCFIGVRFEVNTEDSIKQDRLKHDYPHWLISAMDWVASPEICLNNSCQVYVVIRLVHLSVHEYSPPGRHHQRRLTLFNCWTSYTDIKTNNLHYSAVITLFIPKIGIQIMGNLLWPLNR